LYKISFSKKSEKQLKKLNKQNSVLIYKKLEKLKLQPRNGPNIKSMKGMTNTYRFRVQDYRIVYEVIESNLVVLIVEVDHRKNIYR